MGSVGHPAEIVLLDYLEGTLGGPESDDVRRHVASCGACRRTIAEISNAFDELDRLPTARIPHDGWWPAPQRARSWRVVLRLLPLAIAGLTLLAALVLVRPTTTEHTSTTVQRVITPAAPQPNYFWVRVPPAARAVAFLRRKLHAVDAVVGRPSLQPHMIEVSVPIARRNEAAEILNSLGGNDVRVLLDVRDGAVRGGSPRAGSAS